MLIELSNMSKRKAASVEKVEEPASKRKANGIKGITVAQKSNDSLRDQILATLQTSGLQAESKIVFAHTGIYVNRILLGWVGPTFGITCNNAAQRNICTAHGCTSEDSAGHKAGKYFDVPDAILKSPAKFRKLAEEVTAAAPPPKVRAPKAKR